MKKVVSIVLFGQADRAHYGGEFYSVYLSAFTLAHLNLFPQSTDWHLRIHYDDVVAENQYGALIRRLAEHNLVEAICMGPARPNTASMLWRLAPVFDREVEYVFCRDLDALPMPRDRACCDSFIRSKCIVHAIHDNVQHSGIPGGLCGFHAPALRTSTGWKSLDDLYAAAAQTDEEWARHGGDQLALNRLLVRSGGPRLLEHRYSGWRDGKPAQLPRRPPGVYACGGLSALVPDEGLSALSKSLAVKADRLAPFMGAAGYDHVAARKFWELHGDPEIARLVRECEGS